MTPLRYNVGHLDGDKRKITRYSDCLLKQVIRLFPIIFFMVVKNVYMALSTLYLDLQNSLLACSVHIIHSPSLYEKMNTTVEAHIFV